MKLKDVLFGCEFLDIKWVTVALETATKLRDLQGISIDVPSISAHVTPANKETLRTPWSDLDSLLVQFWESHSIRMKISHQRPGSEDEGRGLVDWSEYLLPESTERGVVDVVEGP